MLVFNLQGLARQTDAAFDKVLALVGRTDDNTSENAWVGQHRLTSILAHKVVVRAVALEGRANRVAVREVEYNGIETLHRAYSWETVIWHTYPLQIRLALAVGQWQHIVHQWERQRCHRCACTVRHLADHQVVAHQERLLHRRRRNLIELHTIATYDDGGNQRKNQSVKPFAQRRVLNLLVTCGVDIFKLAQAQIRHIGKREKHGKCLLPKAVTLKDFSRLDDKHQEGKDVDSRYQEIDIPLPFLAAQLNPKHKIINRYQSLPRSNANLAENEIQSHKRA